MKNRPQHHYTGLHVRGIELHAQCMKQQQISQALGVSQSTVSRWIKAWREQGKKSLSWPKMGGSKPKMDAEQEAELAVILQQGAEKHGFQGAFWTYKRIAAVTESHFGIHYQPRSIGEVLKRIGFSLQKATGKHYKKDEEKVQQWKQEQLPALKKSGRRKVGDRLPG